MVHRYTISKHDRCHGNNKEIKQLTLGARDEIIGLFSVELLQSSFTVISKKGSTNV